MVCNGAVYVGGDDGIMRCYSAKEGDLKWTFDAHGPVLGVPAFSGHSVVFGTRRGEVFALEAYTGALHWTFRVHDEVRAGVTIEGDNYYVPLVSGRLLALYRP